MAKSDKAGSAGKSGKSGKAEKPAKGVKAKATKAGAATSARSRREDAAAAADRGGLWPAVVLAIAAVVGFVYTLAVGNQPLLGLDLQGGVSAVYQPAECAVFDDESLDRTLEVIRNRVDGLGVAEPEISRQGDTIVVDLPGVEQKDRALQLVGETAQLLFRPVILDPVAFAGIGAGQPLDFEGDDAESGDATDPDSEETEVDQPADEADVEEPGDESEESLVPLRQKQDTDDAETDAETDADSDDCDDDDEAGASDAGNGGTGIPDEAEIQALVEEGCTNGVTSREDDDPEAYVLLEGVGGGTYCLGPALLTGEALEDAEVGFDGLEWTVNPLFRAGEDGIDAFNELAAICANPFIGTNGAVCPAIGTDSATGEPRGALAIVLDHEVVSAPLINAGNFDRENVVISGTFDEEGARDLALSLRFGALPVELEPQQQQTVSASIGDDVLRSGVIAGIVGLVLVGLYVLAYYRLAGLVAIGGLLISGLLLWTIISWLGENYGLAISLAGIVGLIVSIGVSTDSNIVYFENVKDIASKGRRVTTAVERAYQSAISTIVKADVVSLIAAGLLYFLTVGAVKGFALYLGIATMLDLLVSYMFMRPALAWLASRPKVQANPRLVGMPDGGASS